MFKNKQLVAGMISLAFLTPLAAMADDGPSVAAAPKAITSQLSPDMFGMDMMSFMLKVDPKKDHDVRFGKKTQDADMTAYVNIFDDNASYTLPSFGTLNHLQYGFIARDASTTFRLGVYGGELVAPVGPELDYDATAAFIRHFLEKTYGPSVVSTPGTWQFKRDPKFTLTVNVSPAAPNSIKVTAAIFERE